MKNKVQVLLAALIVLGAVIPGKAEVFRYADKDGGKSQRAQTAAGCSPSSAFEWLDINNVRTRINAGGDMWWDLPSGTGSKYYIPANGSATSLFAGSLWIAGVDVNQQLKCAAVRFRQGPNLNGGNDFWTGPLTVDGKASITDDVCARWDKIFKITREQVDEFLLNFDEETGKFADGYEVPSIIKNWPAHPSSDDGNVSHYMAPFFDRKGDGEYNWEEGDYPYYDITNELCHTKVPTMDEEIEGTMYGSILADQVLKGDQTLWWVFNDKGNNHTESEGQAIGLEIRAQAFGFATNDEINNMSFYSYEIINRSTYTLTGTYFSPWTDIDLGYGWDDYVGCDVGRGLGYGYNGKAVDGSGEPEAYGNQPPALGIDFFQGPYMDADGIDNPKYETTYINTFDHIDPATGDSIFVTDTVYGNQIVDYSINGVNFGNGIVDDERFGMRRFVYHNNSNDDNGDPKTAPQYYNYLQGIFKNGAKMLYGGNALSGNDVVGPVCDFMFPGDSDPWNWGTGGFEPNGGYNKDGKYWSEEQCQNSPGDRRFMQSAGPFTLHPGAVNYITFGVPWARATSGGAWASVELLRVVDDKCQALFDNCFKVIDGPNAPDLTIRELDQELIIYLSNTALSNNYKEGYVEFDPEIPASRIDAEDVFVDSLHVTLENGTDTIVITNLATHETTETFYDRNYRFEGYKVYQLANGEVGADELENTDKARLVFQCDIKNNVGRLLNYEYDEGIQANVPHLKVEGGDAGITHSFVIKEDKFATGDNPNLVNHKTYYYMAVAYAYNNFLTYNQDDALGLQGQKKPYLEGRKNIQCYSAVPHKIVDGTVLKATYGDKPAIQRIVGQGNGGNELELTDETVAEILGKGLADSYVSFEDNHHNLVSFFIDNNPDIEDTVVFGHPDYPISYHPKYKTGYGPLDVKIIDPLNVVSTNYELVFTDFASVYTHNITNNSEISGDSAVRKASHWFLRDLTPSDGRSGDTIWGDTTTVYGDEKMFIDRGISIRLEQTYDIGRIMVGKYYDGGQGANPNDTTLWKKYNVVVAPNNGVITSSIEFQNPDSVWLSGIRDTDIPSSALNWIRSGTYADQDNPGYNDYPVNSAATGSFDPSWDPNENFEKIAGGTWAPYLLCSNSKQGFQTNPGPVCPNSRVGDYFKKTSSVDIVFTSDTNLWTRCPVIEVCMDEKLSEGNAKRFFLRKHASVDRRGRTLSNTSDTIPGSNDPTAPNYISSQGMGWFPGYAIDVESGMRLNIAFGEDSYYEDLGGRDMIFNPAPLQKTTVEGSAEFQLADPALFRGNNSVPVFGGKHFVYIFRNDSIPVTASSAPYKDFVSPAYDAGARVYRSLKFVQDNPNTEGVLMRMVYQLVMWVGMPMAIEDMPWLPEGNDCRIRIRIAKPYAPGYGPGDLQVTPNELMINNLNPKYLFNIEGLTPEHNNPEKTESDLNLITVVPNPYYAYSAYEGNALTNRVKIANLPEKCVVTIYTLSGTKVRQFNKDNSDPNIDWDLTNFANTPIASGFYLIHIKDRTSGSERVIKFFGAMRKVDLNTF